MKRERERETERQRDRETERQRDRQRETQRDRETERQREDITTHMHTNGLHNSNYTQPHLNTHREKGGEIGKTYTSTITHNYSKHIMTHR